MKMLSCCILLAISPAIYANTCISEPWNNQVQYRNDDLVTHQNAEYMAKWWTKGEQPDPDYQWGAWKKLHDCTAETPTPEPTPDPDPTPDPEPTPANTLTAEQAVLSGSASLSNGEIDIQTGQASWLINIASAGRYQFEFDYRSPYGDKTNTFSVGGQSQSVTTAQTSATTTWQWTLDLAAGNQQLMVDGGSGNWGYIFISQIRYKKLDDDSKPPVDGEYPGTEVTDSTRDNYADYADTIPDVPPEYYLDQDEQTKVVGDYGNIYDKALYDKGYGEDVGIAWAGWNPFHYLGNKAHKMAVIDEYNIKRISFIPTYFIATYDEGVRCNDTNNTLSVSQQVDLLTELVNKGIRINYRPHIDPIKFSWEGASAGMNPGDLDWRGLFDQLDPMGSDYQCVIDQGLTILKQVIENSSTPIKEPIRFDLGAELMSPTKVYPHNWLQLAQSVRAKLNADPKLRDNVILGHNFSHHVQYLVEIEDHPEYFSRIVSGSEFEQYPHLLFVDDMTQQQRHDLAEYIKALDTVTVSQYMPMDITQPITDNTVVDIPTTASDVKDALMIHEQNFIQKVLMGKLGIAKQDLPVFHLGEYGMGIKGLITPNVWDSTAVTDEEKISYEVHQRHAQVAIDGLLQYMQHSESTAKSLLIWVSGAPYDVIGFYKGDGQGMDTGDEGHGYPGMSPFNPQAAQSLKQYWK